MPAIAATISHVPFWLLVELLAESVGPPALAIMAVNQAVALVFVMLAYRFRADYLIVLAVAFLALSVFDLVAAWVEQPHLTGPV
ncbi:MAG: hypothetical protein AAFQ64_17715 [Pseudomonadota bacterium]